MSKTRVYSYLRFSDPKQALGHSAERQLAFAKKWAEESGAELDTNLTLRDEGLSAYHQRHIKTGALGAFLRAIDEGRIPTGSVLVVEGLDRLSRAEPILAQAQLAQIINAGISVVTASDGKIYNRERLKEQPMDLVYSLLVMIRAHEESDTKSKRVSAAIRRQCAAWKAGTKKGIIRNGKDPAWLRWDGERFVEIPEKADPLRRMLNLWLDGHGYASAWKTLHSAGDDMKQLPKTQATFYRMLSKRYIVGTKTITAGGETFELDGYYPPLIDVDTFNRVVASRSKRKWKRGPMATPGVVIGSGITFCGYCGSVMITQNSFQSRKRRDDGLPNEGHRRVRCQHSLDFCTSGGCSVVPIERAIFAYCSDQIRLDALLSPENDFDKASQSALAKARAKVAEIEIKINRITEALLDDTGPTPISFARAARDLEDQLEKAKSSEAIAAEEVNRTSLRQRPTIAKAWSDMVSGILRLDVDIRIKARQMVLDTFERIAIYTHGISHNAGSRSPIDVVLISYGGPPRLIRIDRKTGALIDLEDINL